MGTPAGGSLVGRGYVERANVISGAALNTNGQTTFSKEFPMGEGWYKALLRFNNVFVVGTGTTPIAEGEQLIIKGVLLRTDRGEILCNLPGRALFKMAHYRNEAAPRSDAIAAASATYRTTLPIYFADEFMLRPEDTILDTSRYNSITLQITMGTTADLLGTPGTSTATYTFDCDIERSLGALPDAAKPMFHVNYDYRNPVDANTTTIIDLERSTDMSIKRLFVWAGTSGTGGIPCSGVASDAIQNVVNLKDQNRFIEMNRVHAMIQDQNIMDQGLAAKITGLEVFEFVRDRSIAAALATGSKSVLQYAWTNQGGVGANSIVTAFAEMIRTLK